MPSFPIVDSHVHLYDPSWLRYSWLQRVPKIDRRYDLGRLRPLPRPRSMVDKLVFAEVAVDPGLHFAEAAWVQELADRDPRLAGMVAHAPLEKGAAVEADLERLAAVPLPARHPPADRERGRPELLPGAGFPRGLQLLPAARPDLRHLRQALGAGVRDRARPALPRGAVRARPYRQARHPARAGRAVEEQLRELARLPNVVCKLSGVITEADHQHWRREQVRPYVAHVLECFGFDRVMYGSDWTVSELTHHYPEWVAILDEITAGCSEAELRGLYRETAIRTYRLDS